MIWKRGRRIYKGILGLAVLCFLTGCYQDREEKDDETPSVIQVTRRPEEETRKEKRTEEAGGGREETAEGTKAAGLPEMEGSEEERATLLFGGDVLLSDHVLAAYEKAGGIHGVLDEGYRNAIRQADFFMVNEEFPFSDRGTKAEDKQFTFRLPPEKAALFQELEIDGVSLANNHALDFGTDALLDTAAILDRAGILHTGAGENLEQASLPVTAEIKGQKIAVIGATRVIPEAGWAAGNNHIGMLATYDPAVLTEKISQLKKAYDYVIVFVHWGIERAERPEEYQRALGRQYIDAGADMVIGSHPHVLQGVEYYKDKPILYSLGNFIFGSSIPRTALLEVKLPKEKGGEISLRFLPGTSRAGYTRQLSEEGEKQEFYQYMESISYGVSFLPDGSIKNGEQTEGEQTKGEE